MNSNTIKGREGEEIALSYLKNNGFVILSQNYRSGKAEVDIITQKEDILIFIEVKYRTGNLYGLPEEAVGEKKMDLLREAAENYIFDTNWTGDLRFDIISIRKNKELLHIEDAF